MRDSQRKSLLAAVIDELARKGYEGTSVQGALAASGVSEGEFADEFADLDGCLFAAYEELCDGVVATATGGCGGGEDPWPDRVRVGLARLLEELAERPLQARALTRSFPGIRPAAYERYVDLLSRFEPFMREGREYSGVEEELPSEVELLAVGAAEAIIFSEVDAGRATSLPRMMPEILFSILVPFLGPERAAEEMRSAAAIH